MTTGIGSRTSGGEIGAPLEPRAVVGEYEPSAGRYTLRTGSGRGAVQTRARLAATLGVPVERCRAVFGDMGGNFGTRNAFSPEFALIPWAARRTGRPVRWTADRRECFLSDYHARDLVSEAALALDAEGNFLALRGVNTLNLGAYAVYFWPLRKGLSMMQGVYRIPAVHFRGHAVLTNTAPTAVYRSAGRPEAIYMVERLIDLAAEEHGFDRVALRRRNLIAPGAMPYTNAVGVTYDSGDYPAAMDAALDAADWSGFEARRAESARRGRRRGIAVANYIEVTSGIPRERAELRAPSPRTTRACPRTCTAPSKASATSPTGRAAFPTAPMSARSRSIPRPARYASRHGPGWTTSALRSIPSSCTARRRARSCRGWARPSSRRSATRRRTASS